MSTLKNHLEIDTVAALIATAGYALPVAREAVIHASKILGLRTFGRWLHIPPQCTDWLLKEAKAAAEALTAMEQRRNGRA